MAHFRPAISRPSKAAFYRPGRHLRERHPRPDPDNTASKDPADWVTGDEAMTGPLRSYLDTLAREAGEELPADLIKAQASEQIDRLQQETGRGN